MRLSYGYAVAITAAALTLAPLTAFAHDNGYQHRHQSNGDDQLVGGVIGAIAGGVIGSQVAGSGARTEGSVLGAVIGGVAGASIAGGNNNRHTTHYGGQHNGGAYYNGGQYNTGGYYQQPPRYNQGYSQGYSQGGYYQQPTYSHSTYYSQPTYSHSYYQPQPRYYAPPAYYGGTQYRRPSVSVNIGYTNRGYRGGNRGYRHNPTPRRRGHHRRYGH